MISITPIGNAENASQYYTNEEKDHDLPDVSLEKTGDNYYLREKSNEQNTQWFGKLATEKGVDGKAIDQVTLEKVLSGELQEETVHARRNNHRSGFDLTFSAPKSVSILALVGGDKRLLDAHNRAVKFALSEIESDAAQARHTDPETQKQEYENTGSMLFGLVQHKTSREDDPSLHTHALAANMTRDRNGKLRALASCLKQSDGGVNGTAERIYNNQKYYTALYQSALARSAENIGYEMRSVGNGQFEIKGVPETLIEAMSKRSLQIQEKVDDLGFDSQAARDFAAKNTRKEKSYASESSLLHRWQQEIKYNGFDVQGFVAQSYHKDIQAIDTAQTKARAIEAVKRTIDHLGQTQTKLTFEKIVTLAVSDFTKGEAINALDAKIATDSIIKSGELIPLDNKNASFTTKKMIDNEKALINATAGRPRHMRIHSNEKALEQLNLNKDNTNKLSSVLYSTKQFNVVNVFGSSEQLAKGLLHVGSESGKHVHILSPDARSNAKASKKITRTSHTISQWIKNAFRPDFTHTVKQYLNDNTTPYSNRDLIVVDASNKLSVSELKSITDKVKISNSKVVLLNNVSSRQGMKANSAIDVLAQGNVHQTNWVNNKASDAKVLLHGQDHTNLAQLYAKIPDKAATQVLATSKAEVNLLNTAIRSELKQTGQLSWQSVAIDTLNPYYLSDSQRDTVTHYQPGMVLREWNEVNGKRVSTDHLVASTNRAQNTLQLLDELGKVHTIDPSSKAAKARQFSVFKQDRLELSTGDQVRTNTKHYPSQLPANTEFRVVNASDKGVTFEDREGKSTEISTADLKNAPLTYAFVATAHHIDENKPHIMIASKAYALSKELLNDMAANSYRIDIFADNHDKVTHQLDKNEVRPSAIERIVKSATGIEKYLSNKTQRCVLNDVNAAISALNGRQSQSTIEKAVNFAVNHISEKEAAFTQKELVVEAIRYSFEESGQSVTKGEILSQLVKNDSLLSSEFHDGTRWTTQSAINTEKNILSSFEEGKGQVTPMVSQEAANRFLDKQACLTEGQKSSTSLITTTADRFVAVQGLAGTGKSTMLEKNIELILQSQNLANQNSPNPPTILGLAPTHAAVSELKNKGVEAQTIQSLLSDIDAGKKQICDYKNTLFFLDESSMTGNKQMADFISIVNQSDSRAVLLGDIEQLLSLSAGKPFELAIKSGVISVAYMTDIVRQKGGALLEAVHNIVDKQAGSALSKLKQQGTAPTGVNKTHHVVSTYAKTTNSPRLNQQLAIEELPKVVSEDYLSRTPASREDTLIIAYTNRERDQISHQIRADLTKNDELGKEHITVPRMRSIGASREELGTMMPYKEGLILSTSRGSYATITEVDKQHGLVLVKDVVSGTEMSFFPLNRDHKYTNLFALDRQPLSTNDRVITRFTDKDRGIEANKEYKVISAESDIISLKSKDGQDLTLDPANIKDGHWDYGYTRTADMAQGSTFKYVIAAIKSTGKLTNIRRAYIDLTRASEHVKLYTDNTESTMRTWLSNDSNKRSAIETTTHAKPEKHIYFNDKPLPDENPKYQDINGNLDYKKMGMLISKELSKYTESLAIHLLGNANTTKSDRDYLSFGTGKTSLKVSLTGQYRGYFKDWTTGEKGNMINLIMHSKGLSYKEALFYADEIIQSPKKFPLERNEHHEQLLKTTPKQQSKLEHRAKEYFNESQALSSTVGESYLINCGIAINNKDNIRFHPNVYSSESRTTHPAIIAGIENKDKEIKGIEITYLDQQGNMAELEIQKRILGSKSGNQITFNQAENTNISIITTSIENAYRAEQVKKQDADIVAVTHKNDIQNLDANLLRENIIVVLDQRNDNLNTNNIEKIMAKFNEHNIAFITNDNLSQQINEAIDKIEKDNINITLNDELTSKEELLLSKYEDNLTEVHQNSAHRTIQINHDKQFAISEIRDKANRTMQQNEGVLGMRNKKISDLELER